MYIKTIGCRSTHKVCELRKSRYQADAVNCAIYLTELDLFQIAKLMHKSFIL